MAIADRITAERRRSSLRLPRSLWIGVAATKRLIGGRGANRAASRLPFIPPAARGILTACPPPLPSLLNVAAS